MPSGPITIIYPFIFTKWPKYIGYSDPSQIFNPILLLLEIK